MQNPPNCSCDEFGGAKPAKSCPECPKNKNKLSEAAVAARIAQLQQKPSYENQCRITALLYNRYAGRLLITASEYVDEWQVEDVVQTVFTKVFDHALRFQPDYPHAWLNQLTAHTGQNYRRAEDRRKVRELISESNLNITRAEAAGRLSDIRDALSNFDDPFAGIELREVAEIIRDAVSRLPQHKRVLIEMRFLEERPWTEVALALGISEGAARSRCKAALNTLEKEIRKDPRME
jgi:RNA polymerase sigma factor (sigma-70 family)